jgi:hypothetical protein
MLNLICKSVLSGIVLITISIIIALLIENKPASKILFFPSSLILSSLMGGRHPMGYTEQGEPIVEGTPADGIFVLFALFFQTLFLSLMSFLVFYTLKKRKTK